MLRFAFFRYFSSLCFAALLRVDFICCFALILIALLRLAPLCFASPCHVLLSFASLCFSCWSDFDFATERVALQCFLRPAALLIVAVCTMQTDRLHNVHHRAPAAEVALVRPATDPLPAVAAVAVVGAYDRA